MNDEFVGSVGEADAGRGRSSVDFPYCDLGDGEDVVLQIHRNAGSSCSVEQLAAFMGQAARGGGFRMKVMAAKTFGLIENPRGQVVLTELGRKMADPAQQPAARIEAFLNVGLFRKIYERFKGNVLPPRPAMTREIQSLGVIGTQADRARQVFERSAEQAGFFSFGKERLVMPVVQPERSGALTMEGHPPVVEIKRPETTGIYDPLVQGLLNRLPEPGSEWAGDARATWLRALVMNFDVLYTDQSGKRVLVSVSDE